jgi:hypothetical protein
MFHAALAASNFPARSPTRGSGVGAPADMLLLPLVEMAGAHAAANRPTARANANNGATVDRAAGRRRKTDTIVDSSDVAE